LYNIGIKQKKRNLNLSRKYKSTLWDNIIFKKIANKLGGRIRFMITGNYKKEKNIIFLYYLNLQ
jgi:long-subunit acyl-CoA synthetase (AMP-forming)